MIRGTLKTLLAFIFFLGAITPLTYAASDVIIVNSYSEAIIRAELTGKKVFIYFGATWCGPCRQMHNDVFTHPKVKIELDKYIQFYVDIDKDTATANLYKVSSVPAYYILNIEKKLIERTGVGRRSSSEFLQWLGR